MKITLISPVPPYKGGISEFSASLAKELKKEHELQVISWKQQYPFLIKDRIDKEAEKFEGAEFILDYKNPFTWKRAKKMVGGFKPDVVILPWVTPLAAPVLIPLVKMLKKVCPRVIPLCHNVLPHEKTFVDKILAKRFFKQFKEAIVHSAGDKKALEGLNPQIKVKKGFHPIYDTYSVEKKASALEGMEGNIILFFGFVREYKGLKYLLKTMPLLLEKVDVKLLVVGEFWQDKEEYFELIKKLGIGDKVKVISDYVPNEEVGSYFEKSDVVVLPYTSGTQSGIIQLAYNFDTPVICTDVGGFAEVVKDGKTGYVIPAKDEKALAEAIIKFYKYQQKKPMQKLVKEAKKNYSWSNYCKILLE